MSTSADPRLTRAHEIHAARASQIALNLLAIAGGRPYIEARLARLPFESDASWYGRPAIAAGRLRFSRAAAGPVPGRMARAFLINYASRSIP